MSDPTGDSEPEPGEQLGGESVPAAAAAAAPSDQQPETPEQKYERLRSEEFQQLLDLREKYAQRFQWAVYVQLALADVVFLIYAFANGWDIPAGAIEVWLAATVVETIGVVLAITRSVFNPRELTRR